MSSDMSNNKKKIIIPIIIVIVIILTALGTTIAFFNYTRTGSLNNLGTGRIYFNSTQSGSLNITNVFPMTSSEAGNAELDTVTIGIVGDTTYSDGEEFEITLVDVTNTINNKKIPINYIATYTPVSGKSIGTESNDYWNARNSKNADIYILNEAGEVKEGKQVLVGFIKNSNSGIEGTLTIKAYIDADRIAISDTYPTGSVYKVNDSMTSEEVNYCISFFSNINVEVTEAFCRGTAAIDGYTFQEWLDSGNLLGYESNDLEEHGVIKYLGENGTTNDWVNGRTVLTTTEWNNLQSTPISFKIRAESNEGIWVEPNGTIKSCKGCKFIYTGEMYTTWNDQSQTPTVLTTGLYDNYEELIETTGRRTFLGVKLNNNNEITNAYACGIYGDEPFCIEGTSDGSKYSANQSLINGSNLWNNTCTIGSNYIECGGGSARASSDGSVSVEYYQIAVSSTICQVSSSGTMFCSVHSNSTG